MYIYISTEYWPEHSFKILSYTFDLLIGYFHVYSLSKFMQVLIKLMAWYIHKFERL